MYEYDIKRNDKPPRHPKLVTSELNEPLLLQETLEGPTLL